jgi:hypothetical protein
LAAESVKPYEDFGKAADNHGDAAKAGLRRGSPRHFRTSDGTLRSSALRATFGLKLPLFTAPFAACLPETPAL